jgi:hypothetical protein
MNLRKYIQKEISKILSESDYLPLGAQYIEDAPYNQQDPTIRKGKNPTENKYSSVWYGEGAGISILEDSSGKLYAFYYSGKEDRDFEPYANLEAIGGDEDGLEYADLQLDGDTLAAYVNDNLDSLTTGSGKQGEIDGKDIVSIDQDWKESWLEYANRKGFRFNNAEFIKVISDYNPPMNESVLYEAKMPNEDFAKIVFEYDFPNNEKRLELINIIKDYFGEPLNKGREDKYWSTYVPKVELQNFLFDAQDFNPYFTKEIIQANRFKPLTKELQAGDKIKFFDYTVNTKNPPRAEGSIKEVYKYLCLLKWNNGGKEAFIQKSMIDKYYFYHGDLSDSKNNPGNDALLDPNNPIIIFDDDQFYGPSSKKVSKKSPRFDDFKSDDENADNYEGNVGEVGYDKYREEKLRGLIKKYGGKLEFMFGNNTDKNGRWYTLIPLKKGGNKNNADDFIQAAEDFGAGYGETAGNIYLEDKALNEIRKIVRGVINKVIK